MSFISDGHTITFTAGATLTEGQFLVIGQKLVVVAGDYVSGDSAEAYTSGVFPAPKVSAAVIAQGESVIWDASAGAFDDNLATPATGDVSGGAVAWEAKGNGDTTIAVKIGDFIGTVA